MSFPGETYGNRDTSAELRLDDGRAPDIWTKPNAGIIAEIQRDF